MITDDDGTQVRIVCGSFWGKSGQVDGIAAEPVYLDVTRASGTEEDAARGGHAARICICVRGRGEVL